jgi:hypothetical protein
VRWHDKLVLATGNGLYVVPLEGATRTCPGARPAVWRSENAGGKWQGLTDGLPKKDAWFTILRDALDAFVDGVQRAVVEAIEEARGGERLRATTVRP